MMLWHSNSTEKTNSIMTFILDDVDCMKYYTQGVKGWLEHIFDCQADDSVSNTVYPVLT